MFSPHLGPIQLLCGFVQSNQGESLAFGQTSQLRQEIKLSGCNCTLKLCNTKAGS